MFTGIIEHTATLYDIKPNGQGLTYYLESTLATPALGESIAVNGVCLTVIEASVGKLAFDISPETLEKTTLGTLEIGTLVHLEKPLTLTQPLGGHFVTGHVDEVLTVEKIEKVDKFSRFIFSGVSRPQWLCEKGSITLDGVSLTVNAIPTNETVECMLIPHTLSHTRFGSMKEQDRINAEYDTIAKIVARQHAIGVSTE